MGTGKRDSCSFWRSFNQIYYRFYPFADPISFSRDLFFFGERSRCSPQVQKDIVIFNAAIFENDFINGLDFEKTRKMIEINYLSVIKGIQALFPLLKTNSQVIAISSSSALKGSGEEGIGYAASKAALSIAFESLYLKYRNKIHFKTVFFGPVKTGMSPFSRHTILSLSEEDAVRAVIKSIERGDVISYYPLIIFYAYKLAKLLPSSYYFKFLTFIDEKIHQRLIVESDD